ncbi:integrin alpha-4-like [Saccostrea echinata]|uniref:integrin alpha-4-like n=1 Tax=Saccostrea echinata TaxID=191078 RepID=UPI002A815B3E|nr:integrin alpha-4-like [Saccostrea echinata]
MATSYIVVKLMIFLRFVSGFNIDVEQALIYTGTPGSYYGATTELVSNAQGKWLLVGAPRQNYSGIIKPGAIYRCAVDTSSASRSCTIMNIRAAESAFPSIESEENQGLGLNMLVTDQNLVACSPMWKEAVTADIYFAYGKCSDIPLNNLNTNNNKLFQVPSNLRILNGRIHYVAAEFGFSSSRRTGFSNNGIVLGTPVVYDSTGGFVFYQEGAVSNFWERFNIMENGAIDNLRSMFRAGAYLGYSIGAGIFGSSASPSAPQVALGAPGFANNEGTVGAMGIFERDGSNLRMRKLLNGKTVGSGFGQSMVVADFNGDNRDDIAVGSPMEGEDGMNNVDVGAVYVYYGTGSSSTYIDNEQRLRGSGAVSARFGYSVANPGDLNKDGFNDLVVGAPYEDDNKGAIYIFNGGSPQMDATFSQQILASKLNTDLRGFGFSLSKSTIDVDSNTFLDISVGSLLSSNAVVLRTQSIANITVTLTLNPVKIPLNSTGLACRGNNDNPCTSVQICFSYTGDGLNNGIYIDYTLTSDSDRTDLNDRRFTFYMNNVDGGKIYKKMELLIRSGVNQCETLHARAAMTDRNFFSRVNDDPMFDLTYQISNRSASGEVKPVLDRNQASDTNITGEFRTECDPECKPDLTITGRPLTSLITVGRTQELEVELLVMNLGDPAYGASILVSNDINVPLTSYAVLLEQGSERMTCASETNGTRCVFETTPLYPQQRGLVRLRYDVSVARLLEKGLRNLPAKIQITSTADVSGDINPSNNVIQMSTDLQLEATIQMIGSSSPDQVRMTPQKRSKLLLYQAYSISTLGPSPLPEVKVVFSIPVITNGKVIVPESELKVTEFTPTDKCNMTSFPTLASVTSSPSIGQPSVVINTENSLPLGCEESGVGCAVYECKISELTVESLHGFIINGNISEENLPELQAGITQIRYYTTGVVYPSETLGIPLKLASNVSFSAVLPIFPNDITPAPQELNLWPLIVGLVVGVLLMVLLGIILWKLGFFRRKKREELDQYKRKSYAYQRQSRALLRATKDMDKSEREILSQYSQIN